MADNFLDRVPEALKKDYAFNGVPALVGAGMTDKALQLASQLLSPEGAEQFGTNPTKVFQYLSNNYVSSGIGTANLVDWLQKLPTPELRASGEAEFMKVIIKEDPGSAIPWLQSSESGDTRDGYLAQLLDDLPTDHENYEQMLDLIENPEMRTAAEEAAASRPRFDLPSDED